MSRLTICFLMQSCLVLALKLNIFAAETWIPSQNPALQLNHYSAIARPVKELDISSEVSGLLIEYPVEFGREIEGEKKIKIDATRMGLEVKLNEAQLKAAKIAEENAIVNVRLQSEKNIFYQKELRRAQNLFEKGSLSQGQLDQKSLEAETQQIALQQSKLKEAESKSMVEQAKAKLLLSRDWLSRYEIELPAGWVVSHKYVEEKTLVRAHQPLVRLADLSQYKFLFYLKAEEVLYLQKKSNLELRLSKPIQESLRAQLVGVSPVADMKTQKLQVELRVNNASKRDVISGVMARMELKLPEANGYLQVPKKFVLEEFEQKYLVDEQERKYPISVIRSVGDHFFISGEKLPDIPYVVIQP